MRVPNTRPWVPEERLGGHGSLGHPSEDETGLIYMRARHYDPVCGRFVSEDPARNGSNWYSYCSGNPVGRRDRTGRETEASIAVGMDGSMIIDGVGLDLEQTNIWCDLSQSGRFAKVFVEFIKGDGPLNIFGLKNALQSWAMGNNIQVIQILARGLTTDGEALMHVMDTMVSNGAGLSSADNGMTQLYWILSI